MRPIGYRRNAHSQQRHTVHEIADDVLRTRRRRGGLLFSPPRSLCALRASVANRFFHELLIALTEWPCPFQGIGKYCSCPLTSFILNRLIHTHRFLILSEGDERWVVSSPSLPGDQSRLNYLLHVRSRLACVSYLHDFELIGAADLVKNLEDVFIFVEHT